MGRVGKVWEQARLRGRWGRWGGWGRSGSKQGCGEDGEGVEGREGLGASKAGDCSKTM